jgi:hypothetical protein
MKLIAYLKWLWMWMLLELTIRAARRSHAKLLAKKEHTLRTSLFPWPALMSIDNQLEKSQERIDRLELFKITIL